MGTRSIIVITGPQRRDHKGEPCDYRTFRLYKHWDGYPSANLKIIDAALHWATKMVAADDKRFRAKESAGLIPSECLAGLIIGAATTTSGMGARPEFDMQDPFELDHLGDQSDLEYIYIIDTEARTLNVYGAQFDKTPQENVAAGTLDLATSDPEVMPIVDSIEAWSFKVNPKPAPSNVVQLKPKTAPDNDPMLNEPSRHPNTCKDAYKDAKPRAKKRGSKLQAWQLNGGK